MSELILKFSKVAGYKANIPNSYYKYKLVANNQKMKFRKFMCNTVKNTKHIGKVNKRSAISVHYKEENMAERN